VGHRGKFSEKNKQMLTLKRLTALGRPRRKWVDIIKWNLGKQDGMGWDGLD
jgi:hypothetical protein